MWRVLNDNTNETIYYTFFCDTLLIDSYFNNQLYEGDCYTIKIHNDIINVYYAFDTPFNNSGDEADFYIVVLYNVGDNELACLLINKNDNTSDKFTLVREK